MVDNVHLKLTEVTYSAKLCFPIPILMPKLATWNNYGKTRICSLFPSFYLLNFLNNTKRMMTVRHLWKIT